MTDGDFWRQFRLAVREATRLGAEFRVNGADVEVDGVPDGLRDRLDPESLRDYFGITRNDDEALDFADRLGVEAVLVTDRPGLLAMVEALRGKSLIGLDIETAPRDRRPPSAALNSDGSIAAHQPKDDNPAGLDPHRADIACAQLYGGDGPCFVVRGDALNKLLSSNWIRAQRFVAHNAAFESKFLQHAKIEVPIDCTAQATGLLHGVERFFSDAVRHRSLADACFHEFGYEPPKALQTSAWGAARLSPGQVAYAASDAILARRLWHRMAPRMPLAAYVLQRDAIPAVAAMELCGLGFDAEEHVRQVEEWSRQLSAARQEYIEVAGESAPDKTAEVQEWIARVAPPERLAKWKRTAGGGLSTSAKHIKWLILDDVAPVKPLLAIKAHKTLLQSFGPNLANFVSPATGRIHCSFNIGATKAGRFSASRPNLQQLPSSKAPDFKKCIVAAPGNLLISCDWSQVEMRAAAWVSGDATLTAVYREQRDLHVETAAVIARIPAGQVSTAQRQVAKPVNYGSIYGISAEELAVNAFANYGIELTVAESKQALDRFFSTYRGFDRWRWENWRRCKATKRVVVPGSGRIVEGAWEFGGKLRFTQCCNIPLQGIAADAMLRAIAMVHERLRGMRAWLVATVHDELLVEAGEADAERAQAILGETMTEAFAMTFPGAPLGGVVEVKVGKSWRH